MDDHQHAQHQGRKDQDIGPPYRGEIHLPAQFPEEQPHKGGTDEGPQEETMEHGADVQQAGDPGGEPAPGLPQEPAQGPHHPK